MGEIAEMMLDGTMDCETGEWNFDGEDGPGFPMTGAQAAAYRRGYATEPSPGPSAFKMTKALRARVEKFGTLRQCDTYHWQVRQDRLIIADWWPHKRKYRFPDAAAQHGTDADFVADLKRRDALKAKS